MYGLGTSLGSIAFSAMLARQGNWKLVQTREGKGGSIQIAKVGPVRLYDRSEDVAEQKDLAK
jgi:hypothetical protein